MTVSVDAFLEVMQQPPRRRPVPRVAEPLRNIGMHRIPGEQGSIAAWRLGAGPAVLLVHGFEDDNALWTPLIHALALQGRAIVVLDLPAHGLSEGSDGYSVAGADAIKQVAASLGPIDAPSLVILLGVARARMQSMKVYPSSDLS